MPFGLKKIKPREKAAFRSPSSEFEKPEESPVRVSKAGLIALHQQAEGLSLRTVKIRATQGGQYLSPFKGRGMEFDEVRLYQPGDDARTLDWRVTARTGKPHTKLFREERERSVLFWVDYRAPMFFATRGLFKSVMAARAAALLAWSAVQHGDRIGGLIFSEALHHEMRPQRGKKGVLHFISNLVEHPAWQGEAGEKDSGAAAAEALLRLRRVARPGSLIFLIGDFRAIEGEAQSHLAQLARSNDVVMLFLYDPLEQALPPPGFYRVRNASKALTLDTRDAAFRASYAENFQRRHEALKALCRRNRIFHLPCASADNLLQTLQRGLGLGFKSGAA